ncbi:MAG: hypothetical protein IKW13_00515, partial [Thermoguttaceae bacterium]|nr:hypothetical protein [Thermoguttaceae bacterium]
RRRRKRRDSTRPRRRRNRNLPATLCRLSDAVIDLQIEGQPKPIGCTTTHPFWSVDRQDFVEAGRLQQGERVQLYSGETKRVVQKLPRPGPVNVYNLEVYAERAYRVTPDGVLTHNESCGGKWTKQTYPHRIGTEIIERNVYVRNDLFDWTEENIKPMKAGNAPKDKNERSIELQILWISGGY